VRSADGARLWSRQGKDLTDRFPDIAAAAVRQGKDLTDRFPDIAAAAVRQIPAGVVLDREVVILLDGKLSFDALQRRLVTAPSKARKLVADAPASYVASTCWRRPASICARSAGPYAAADSKNSRRIGPRRCSCHRSLTASTRPRNGSTYCPTRWASRAWWSKVLRPSTPAASAAGSR
jgi:hypothetical protein